jgi:hypothetical protein
MLTLMLYGRRVVVVCCALSRATPTEGGRVERERAIYIETKRNGGWKYRERCRENRTERTFSWTLSSESGESTAKQMRMTCESGYESGRSRS